MIFSLRTTNFAHHKPFCHRDHLAGGVRTRPRSAGNPTDLGREQTAIQTPIRLDGDSVGIAPYRDRRLTNHSIGDALPRGVPPGKAKSPN
jgi:hypothetical protein